MRIQRMGLLFMAFVLVFSMPAIPAYAQVIESQTASPDGSLTNSPDLAQPLANPCASSTPSSGAYTVTLCFTAPSSGSTVSGPVTVTVSVSVSGSNPGVQRVVFYINSSYLLTDYLSAYTFSLPTMKWQDGAYTLGVEALMRDGYTTVNRATISLIFSNGNAQPPINPNTFTPTSGTTPPNGSPFIVTAAGDGADGATYAGKVSSLITTINPNLFLYLGDVYEKGSVSEFYNWYGTGGANFSNFLSITDPTIGNHEYSNSSGGAGYFDYWNNIPNYYSFNAGGWHFISLNSNAAHIGVSKTSAQYAWLAQDLAANASLCTIVYYHHPLFNIGPEGPTTAMTDIWALMAQNGVSIVLNGHDHDYQRWVPLDGNGNPSASGITEFVAGGGGHGLQTISKTDSRVVFSDYLNPRAFGVIELALNTNGASFSYINTSGVTLDSGTIPCNKTGPDTQAPSVPAGLTATATSATQVNLAWQASTDNVGVNGYTIYRNNTSIATVSGATLSYTDNTVLPSTTYTYTVDAFDAAGNHSAQSSPASVTTPAMPSSLTFAVGADTYVNAGSPSTNYGSATVWRVDGSPDLHAYLRFTVQGLAGSPIQSVYLKVYTNSSSSVGIKALQVADNTWGETTVTYNTAPALGSTLASSGAITAGSWVTLNVSSYITGEGIYSFGITTPGSSSLSFASKELGANGAQLVINLGLSDTEAPSVPAGLSANAVSATQVNLAWQASTDNVGVTGYTIYRNNAVLTTVSGSTLTYSDTSVSPSTTYSYTADAFDAAGNHSAQSAAVSVTTPGQDTQAPSIPAGLTANAVSATQVNLAWQASTDNVGVTGYTIYRNNAVLTTVSGTTLTYSDATVSPSTTYSYTVDAFDAGGNHSAQSAAVSVTTPAAPTNLTFAVGADTYVNSGSPSSNYGSATVWRVDGSPDLHAYLKFTVQGTGGTPIKHAYLHVFANSSSSAGINAFTVGDNSWGELTITYNTSPPLGSLLGSSGSFPAGSWVTIDVSSFVTGEGIFSFGINTLGATQISLAAKESGVNVAYLVVTFQ